MLLFHVNFYINEWCISVQLDVRENGREPQLSGTKKKNKKPLNNCFHKP